MDPTPMEPAPAQPAPVDQWTEISRHQVWNRYGRGVDEVGFRLPDGRHQSFFVNTVRPAVCVLPLTDDQRVILVEQYRPGPKQVLREMPGGYVDAGEDPAAAAERELLEETGYRGGLTPIGLCYDDGYSTMVRHCFAATGCVQVADPAPDGTEFLRTVLVSLPDFRAQLRAGRCTDVEVGYLALDHLGLL